MGARNGRRNSAANNVAPGVAGNTPPAAPQSSSSGSNSYPGMQHRPSSSQMYVVTIPQGIGPGQNFAVMLNGQRHIFQCPPNARAGSRVHLSIPSSGPQGIGGNNGLNSVGGNEDPWECWLPPCSS